MQTFAFDLLKHTYGFEIYTAWIIKRSIRLRASGGAGQLNHLVDVVQEGKASAVLAASIFDFGTYTIREAKEALLEAGLPARL